MAIRCRSLVCAAALVGVSTLITSQVVSQQYEQDMEAMMQKWMELAQPGPEHANLVKMAGRWSQESRHWMEPGAEPQVSTSKAEMKAIMGGRFVVEHVTGQMDMGGKLMDFEGMGIFGFDNLKQKHVFAWLDNMGTMIMTAEGTADATGDVITYYSTMPNPMTGSTTEIKSVSRRISDDEFNFEMHEKQTDGTWTKNFDIISKRKM